MILSLTPASLRSLGSRPEVVAAFPFLKRYNRPPVPGCCGGGGPDPQKAISAIMNLPSNRKSAFKTLVGADKVVGQVVRAGRLVTVEF